MRLKYFKLDEFDSPDQPGSGEWMNTKFLERLDTARGNAGIPFKISSGYRTESHNDKVGGVDSSTHTKGLAADIIINNSWERFTILTVLMEIGFTRFGIGSHFIHVDIGDHYGYTGKLIWKY